MNYITVTVPKISAARIAEVKEQLAELGPFFTAPIINSEAKAVRHAVQITNDKLPTQNCVTGTKSISFDEATNAWTIELTILD